MAVGYVAARPSSSVKKEQNYRHGLPGWPVQERDGASDGHDHDAHPLQPQLRGHPASKNTMTQKIRMAGRQDLRPPLPIL